MIQYIGELKDQKIERKISEAYINTEIGRSIDAFFDFIGNENTDMTVQEWLKAQFLRFYKLGRYNGKNVDIFSNITS